MPKILFAYFGIHALMCCITYIFAKNNDMNGNLLRDEIKRSLFKYHPFLKSLSLSDDIRSLYVKSSRMVKRDVEEIKNHPGVYKIGKTIYQVKNGKLVPYKREKSTEKPKMLFVKNLNVFPFIIPMETLVNDTNLDLNSIKLVNGLTGDSSGIVTKLQTKTTISTAKTISNQDNQYEDFEKKLVLPIVQFLQKRHYKTKKTIQKLHSCNQSNGNDEKHKIEQTATESITKKVESISEVENLHDTEKSLQIKKSEEIETVDLLEKILGEVESLGSRKNSLVNGAKEDFPCNMTGSWISEAAGTRIDISPENDRFVFKLSARSPKSKTRQGFMIDGNWTASGNVLFSKLDIVSLNAIESVQKRVASFIGQCKVCGGSETVSGQWLIAHRSRDCKDREASQQIVGDIWRPEHLHRLKKGGLDMDLNTGKSNIFNVLTTTIKK